MRIAGSSDRPVGSALGGNRGSRVSGGLRLAPAEGEGLGDAPIRAVGDALADAEVVVLAVPARAVPDLIAEHGPKLAGTL